MSSPSEADPVSRIVLSVAAVFFLASAFNTISALRSHPKRSSLKHKQGAEAHPQCLPATKSTFESAVQVSYTVDMTMCSSISPHAQSAALMRAGSLLKLIDVVAGVASRRHSSLPCVTVSVDSVLILRPVWAGEVIHLSASVNRAWGSSLEVGVRVDKDKGGGSGREYVSHAYMTFVALPAGDKKADGGQRNKVQLPTIAPRTRLEARRHLLAGVRRSRRIDDARRGEGRDGVSTLVKGRVRDEVLSMCDIRGEEEQGGKDKAQLKSLIDEFELEFMARALSNSDPNLLLDEQQGIAEIRMTGDEPLIHSLMDVRAKQAQLQAAGGMIVPTESSRGLGRRGTFSTIDLEAPSPRPRISSSPIDINTPIPVSETLARSLHLVFPEHANSHNILFGGNTMSWLELAAHLSAARLLPTSALSSSSSTTGMWRTLTLDHLPFPHPAHVGDVMEFFAIVVRTWVSSCEVYVLATVERQGEAGGRRWTNDALLTLALREDLDPSISKTKTPSQQRQLRPISFAADSALEAFASMADKRKEQRLEMRDLLMRLYG